MNLLVDELKTTLEIITGKNFDDSYQTTCDVLRKFNSELATSTVSFSVKNSDNQDINDYSISISKNGDIVETDDDSYSLPIGLYSYSCSCDGYVSDSGTFEVDVSDVHTGSMSISIILDAATCKVTFDTTPDTATIELVDSENQSVLADEDGSYTLEVGNYTYTASNEGYTTKSDQELAIDLDDVNAGIKSVTVELEEAVVG